MKHTLMQLLQSEDLDLFTHIQRIVEALPDRLESRLYVLGVRIPKEIGVVTIQPNCHALCRALSKFLPLHVHDGYVTQLRCEGPVWKWRPRFQQHSWLTRIGGNEKIIFDPLPLGCISGPALYVQDVGIHFGPECVFPQLRQWKNRSHMATVQHAVREVVRKQETAA